MMRPSSTMMDEGVGARLEGCGVNPNTYVPKMKSYIARR